MDDLTRLAVAAAAGDRVALTAFVRRSQAEVWRLCAYLGGREDADDLTQEAFLRAIKALPAFRGDASARTWLLAIARYTCADAIRRTKSQRRLAARLAQRGAVVVPDSSGATELGTLVNGLEPDRREAFVLTQVLGLSYAEAGEVCECPVGTIRSRVARAREELVNAARAPYDDTDAGTDIDRAETPGTAEGAADG